MSHREKTPSDLIFEALCLRFRSTTNIGKTMTRQELQEATGLTAEALVDALRVLVAPVNEDLRLVSLGGGRMAAVGSAQGMAVRTRRAGSPSRRGLWAVVPRSHAQGREGMELDRGFDGFLGEVR